LKIASGEQVPYSAQVSFAFFPDRRHEANGGFGVYGRCLQRPSQRYKADYAAGIIAYTRSVEPPAVTPDPHISAFGEDGVEVCRYDYSRLNRESGTLGDNIALFVRSDAFQTDFRKPARNFSSACVFLERRCRYFADVNQLLVKLAAHFIYEVERPLNRSSAEQTCN
jgi:hypothetical protein